MEEAPRQRSQGFKKNIHNNFFISCIVLHIKIGLVMKKIFINKIGRRQFLKTSLSGLAFAAFPSISFSQSNPDVVVIGAGCSFRMLHMHLHDSICKHGLFPYIKTPIIDWFF